jgi:glycosyltransferase involved in cell wall biosynthesis
VADGDAVDTVVITSEFRVRRTPDGRYWAPAGFSHDYWTAYLGDAAPLVLLAVRVTPVDEVPDATERLDGPRVSVLDLPVLRPGAQLLPDVVVAWRTLGVAVRPGRGLLLVHPGVVATLAFARARLRRRPYAVQVVGDPVQVGAAVGASGPMRLVFAAFGRVTASACRRAAATAYVTAEELQRRYPPGDPSRSHAFSNVSLTEAPASPPGAEVRRIVTVGTFTQPYKRVDLLLDAVAHLRAEGWDVALDVVGDGRYRPALETQADSLGLGDAVTFHGQVSHARTKQLLADGDVFALCSDTEGLSRALVEALYSGADAIGSSVGGTIELLPPESRFPAGSLPSLVATLRRHLVSRRLRDRSSTAGRACGEQFTSEGLGRRRAAFAEAVLATGTATT